jgi:hypothetical protein
LGFVSAAASVGVGGGGLGEIRVRGSLAQGKKGLSYAGVLFTTPKLSASSRGAIETGEHIGNAYLALGGAGLAGPFSLVPPFLRNDTTEPGLVLTEIVRDDGYGKSSPLQSYGSP